MKKHPNRPALRAIEVVRWIDKGILRVKKILGTPVLFLVSGKNVRQSWRRRRRKKIKKETAVTYLRKGLWLVPRWQPVPDWEIEYLKARTITLSSLGILFLEKGYFRLIFMQVEDLEHVIRQQDHILDKYLEVGFLRRHLPELMKILDAQKQIINKVVQRSVGTASFRKKVETTLRSFGVSLNSILDNAPVFCGDFSHQTKQPVVSFFRTVIRECGRHPFRPIGRRLFYAGRSLDLAISHLENGRPRLARARIKSALKNLTYPEES